MGCDIHPYAEVRINGRWTRSLAKIPDDRDYIAFAFLADVRNYKTDPPITPVSSPRGLPDDCVTIDNGLSYHDHVRVWLGYHSLSWLTLAELKAADLTVPVTLDETKPLYLAAPLLPRIIMALSELGSPDDVRLIFGFDS